MPTPPAQAPFPPRPAKMRRSSMSISSPWPPSRGRPRTCGRASAKVSPCPTCRVRPWTTAPTGMPSAPRRSAAWWTAPTATCITSSRNSNGATCPPNWPCCRSWRARSTRRRSPAPRRPVCGSSSRAPARPTTSGKTFSRTSAATCWPRPMPRWTTCPSCTTSSATGNWRWPPTTGARARWRGRSRATRRPGCRPTTST